MERDAIVVGGGPAGLATAIAGRLEGLAVTVVERASPPIDKACGEGLMPGAVDALVALGVELPENHPFLGIRYLDGTTVAEGRFPPGVAGAGVRRTRLHAALVRRAEEVGVELCWRCRAEGLADGGVLTADGLLRGRFVVGADGLRSRVRCWAGLEGRPARHRRFGVRRHYAVAPWSDLVEVHWADGLEAYVTPVAAGEVGVALLWSGRKARFDELLAPFPALAERLAGARVLSRDRGAGPLAQRARGVVRGRLALVGDASGYVDAITGEGLDLALGHARVLARAMRRDDLASYARCHRVLGRWANVLTELLLVAERRPWLRRRVVRLLARAPGLFDHVLAIHAGSRG